MMMIMKDKTIIYYNVYYFNIQYKKHYSYYHTQLKGSVINACSALHMGSANIYTSPSSFFFSHTTIFALIIGMVYRSLS